jgi:hypothetical protein
MNLGWTGIFGSIKTWFETSELDGMSQFYSYLWFERICIPPLLRWNTIVVIAGMLVRLKMVIPLNML